MGSLTGLLVEPSSELLRRQSPVALDHEFPDLLPVSVGRDPHPDAITAGPGQEERVADRQQRVAFVWVGPQHEQRSGLALSPSTATRRQNDLRRISKECAVDRFADRDRSTRSVTSGSARQSLLTRP